ncbi:MAG: apolipoprotein N-acyltransferase [Candidatus Aminicenantales bacterium]
MNLRIRTTDIILAVFSGLLTALAFPKWSLTFLVWISLIPLFFIVLKYKPSQTFFIGFLAGFSYYALLIYWIPSVPAHYGNLSLPLSLLIYLVFVLFLALFWGVFCLVFSRIYRSFPKSAFMLSPLIWISLEYILTHIFTGFPWGLLGSSQYQNLFFIQMACVSGVYGLSLIIVLFQSMFVFSVKHRKRAPFLITVALLLLIHLSGFLALKKEPSTMDSFKAAVIQGNVSSDIYWDRVTDQEIESLFRRHIDLSRKAYEEGAELVIWPEFSVTLCFSCPQILYQDFKKRLFQFVQETGTTLLLGTNEAALSEGKMQFYNTALCLSPDLSITQYHKIHLVPFGEYTPYKKVFSFIEKMTHAIGDITPGEEYTLHRYDRYLFGSPICYEIIFPDLVRKFVKKGAHFLVTITNDGWYGNSSAPYQHFSMAVFRAVENRRYLLRAATTGISGIIDPHGRVLKKSEMMTIAYLSAEIYPSEDVTIYTRYGDILPFLGLTFTVLFLILALIKRTDERKETSEG